MAPALAVALAPAFALALGACGSCKGKGDEPSRDPNFNPTGDAAGSPSASGTSARASTLTPKERRDVRTRVGNEQCESAAKRVNTLKNRKETDPLGINLLSTCLKYGNAAWYACILEAESAAAADQCSVRLLHPPDEIEK